MSRPETVEVPAMRVVGFSIRASAQAHAEAASGEGPIAEAWQTFKQLELNKKVPNPHVSGEIVAVYHDYEHGAGDEYTLTIGLRVTALHQVPADLDGVEVPFQTYARFPLSSARDEVVPSVAATWRAIGEDDALRRAYTYDLEVYQPEGASGEMRLEILVALSDEAGS